MNRALKIQSSLTGLDLLGGRLFPGLEVLGYCQMSLRDKASTCDTSKQQDLPTPVCWTSRIPER